MLIAGDDLKAVNANSDTADAQQRAIEDGDELSPQDAQVPAEERPADDATQADQDTQPEVHGEPTKRPILSRLFTRD